MGAGTFCLAYQARSTSSYGTGKSPNSSWEERSHCTHFKDGDVDATMNLQSPGLSL